ncbi:hypothetical protein BUB20358_06801 [Burkholderia ubonensis]|nr:hypothetical protein BUB20358_06801 [Burkholderia ubonensis]
MGLAGPARRRARAGRRAVRAHLARRRRTAHAGRDAFRVPPRALVHEGHRCRRPRDDSPLRLSQPDRAGRIRGWFDGRIRMGRTPPSRRHPKRPGPHAALRLRRAEAPHRRDGRARQHDAHRIQRGRLADPGHRAGWPCHADRLRFARPAGHGDGRYGPDHALRMGRQRPPAVADRPERRREALPPRQRGAARRVDRLFRPRDALRL